VCQEPHSEQFNSRFQGWRPTDLLRKPHELEFVLVGHFEVCPNRGHMVQYTQDGSKE